MHMCVLFVISLYTGVFCLWYQSPHVCFFGDIIIHICVLFVISFSTCVFRWWYHYTHMCFICDTCVFRWWYHYTHMCFICDIIIHMCVLFVISISTCVFLWWYHYTHVCFVCDIIIHMCVSLVISLNTRVFCLWSEESMRLVTSQTAISVTPVSCVQPLTWRPSGSNVMQATSVHQAQWTKPSVSQVRFKHEPNHLSAR